RKTVDSAASYESQDLLGSRGSYHRAHRRERSQSQSAPPAQPPRQADSILPAGAPPRRRLAIVWPLAFEQPSLAPSPPVEQRPVAVRSSRSDSSERSVNSCLHSNSCSM